MTRRLSLLALSCLLVAACGGLPRYAETRRDEPARVELVGAPAGAELYVDGEMVGRISDDRRIFTVEKGTRRVEIRSGGTVIYRRDLFVQDGSTRVIDLGA